MDVVTTNKDKLSCLTCTLLTSTVSSSFVGLGSAILCRKVDQYVRKEEQMQTKQQRAKQINKNRQLIRVMTNLGKPYPKYRIDKRSWLSTKPLMKIPRTLFANIVIEATKIQRSQESINDETFICW